MKLIGRVDMLNGVSDQGAVASHSRPQPFLPSESFGHLPVTYSLGSYSRGRLSR